MNQDKNEVHNVDESTTKHFTRFHLKDDINEDEERERERERKSVSEWQKKVATRLWSY